MWQAIYDTRGDAPHSRIRCVERETPTPGAGEVLLEMLAAPINPSDVLTITGQYGALPPLPAVGGNEGVARVAQLGADVQRLAVGDLVLMPVGAGSWSTHAVARADTLLPLPAGGDLLQLAMLTVNPPTASLLLSEFVTLAPGDWVVQNAANSAVGEYLIQLARARGLRTVSVVRRDAMVPVLEALGGDVVLVDGPDLPERVAAATQGAKVRVAFDAVGGTATDRLARSVAIGGTVVNYGAMSGDACKVAPGSFVFRDVTLRGFWLAFWFRRATGEQQRALYGELAQRVAEGTLAARVDRTFRLAQIQDAVAYAAAGGRNGKVLLVP
ncbi:zinc-dependent alcohol dehydrogenase family protein [Gemmatimonas sp.]|uniref:zinc-dependent alcohol dehydrogenase family protein n=1 Tax=Gemmatimonas sp. TaxID=1962908 RepID=UPI0022CC4C4F|nr:zinc-dependent alcohol dehydrogenase family protein [Gemmatimonas sp.]MCZ8203034.1 zinc-dependent alcohol dehydrogenase family protein [Gemmatimonas sp.]